MPTADDIKAEAFAEKKAVVALAGARASLKRRESIVKQVLPSADDMTAEAAAEELAGAKLKDMKAATVRFGSVRCVGANRCHGSFLCFSYSYIYIYININIYIYIYIFILIFPFYSYLSIYVYMFNSLHDTQPPHLMETSYESLDRSLAPSVARSVDRLVDRSVARSLGGWVDRSVARSVDRSVVRSLHRSIARSLGRSFLRSIGGLVDRSVDREWGEGGTHGGAEERARGKERYSGTNPDKRKGFGIKRGFYVRLQAKPNTIKQSRPDSKPGGQTQLIKSDSPGVMGGSGQRSNSEQNKADQPKTIRRLPDGFAW